ncbi:hypothetical protein SAMN05216200_102446 [Oceanicella actignis]|uniref:Glycosyltransferase n=2 Tax=Oceanicella actignis TaxID=1189325 RepID=A0A1M7SHV1_9RHOB|nr:hypothetical protein SAMN04488119_10363 [Oceanicella actignis]SHN58024.1 hypothetical protein SAMN05216200_102446 [Oceanicella actignis]
MALDAPAGRKARGGFALPGHAFAAPPRAMRRPRVILFVKEPRPGRVKTRLARDVGATAAARWFRAQALRTARELARDPRWETILAVSPDAEGLTSRVWPAHLRRMPQGRGDLGARMARALRDAPAGPALIVGGDVPGANRARIARAFALLRGADAVFGPAEDGGFWLVGLARGAAPPPSGLFQGVRWSSPHALSDSLRTFAGRRVAFAETLRDVDHAADLDALRTR